MHVQRPSQNDVLNDVIVWHNATSTNSSAAAHAQCTTVSSTTLHPLRVEGEGERHLINGALGIEFRRHVGSSYQMRHDSFLGQLCLQLLFHTLNIRARQYCLFHTTRPLIYHLGLCNVCICVCLIVRTKVPNSQQPADYIQQGTASCRSVIQTHSPISI